MYVIIAGGGNVGSVLIEHLIERKKEVVVIDEDRENCDDLHARYGVEPICGNATKISVLKEANIERADVTVATMRNDAVNLAFSVLAKSFAVPEIIARMSQKSYYEAYKTAGVTKIVNVVENMILDILHQIDRKEIQSIARLGNGAVEIFLIHVPEKSKIVGKTISTIAANRKMSDETIIAGIYTEDDNEFIVPRGNTKIPPDSDLFVISSPDLVKQTAQFLTS